MLVFLFYLSQKALGAAVFEMLNLIFQSTFDWKACSLIDVHLEIISILVFQQSHEYIDPAMGQFMNSKPWSAWLEASRSSRLRASQTLHSPRSGFARPQDSTRISHCYTIAQIPAVSSKEGAVIGAVLNTRKFHRDHHWHHTQQ
jgi:hypothetical protein